MRGHLELSAGRVDRKSSSWISLLVRVIAQLDHTTSPLQMNTACGRTAECSSILFEVSCNTKFDLKIRIEHCFVGEVTFFRYSFVFL